MSDFAFTSVIDDSLWDAAKWFGVVYGVSPSQPPFVAFQFEDVDAGRQIFDDWRHRFGAFDDFDEIRISIIEGDIPGKPSGYSVTVGSDIENVQRRAEEEGQKIDARYVGTITRWHRMTPKPGSPFLAGFKKAYQQFGEYLILPAHGSESQPQPEFNLALKKRKILLRDIGDVSEKDRDSSILR